MQPTKHPRPICWLVNGRHAAIPLEEVTRLPSVAGRLTGAVVPAAQGGVLLTLPSGTLVIISIPQPLPLSSLLDDGVQTAAWPGWQRAAAAWRSHVVVSTLNNVESLDERRAAIADLLRVSCEFGARIGVDGLGWEGSRLFFPFSKAEQMLQRSPFPPELLVRPVGTAAGLTTRGLRNFGLPEVRDMTKGSEPWTAVPRLWNFATYLIQNGLVTRDGDTIGTDERGSTCVRHTRETDGLLLLELHDR